MKKSFFSLVFWILLLSSLYCQDAVFVLHQKVGDTIDSKEKKDYYLFTEIADSNFDYAYIMKMNSEYILHVLGSDNTTKEILLDPSKINLYRANIEKLSAYHEYEQSIANTDKKIKNDTIVLIDNPRIINESTFENMSDELRTNERLKDDAYRNKLYEQGSEPNNLLYIDFSKTKK